ncbi:chondroadherin-like protein isoform X2 [Melanotaenia boesemani]|uniref:chondroadherin-like protein isoform X2 n=1 Tax=Melanotaenia boesemani TaxID=1250792 RepID=UPI001C04916C|nr:chondroadherin-like protein isoform X2 [Melanotaenia boesemani]
MTNSLKIQFVSTAVILLILPLSSSIKARKCPKECSCDDTKLIVGCVGKNLTHIPPTIDENTVKLDLRSNNLQMLSRGAFMHTPFLTHLNLQRCNIVKVKEGAFRALGRLVSLNLANNKIDILYQGLQNIKWLRLSHNSLNNLAPEAFTGLFTLSRLNLDHNELQFFPTQTMTRLPEVRRLDMSYNPMTYLGEESVFMAKLTHLYLNHMSLQDLSDQAFSQAPVLSQVDLSHNQLHYLERLSGPKDLITLNLTGNPIYCNCFMRPLKEWATAGGVKLLGACAGPPHLDDEPLQAVTSLDLRCRSRGEILKEEDGKEQESKGSIPTTATPKQSVKCPLNCECDTEAHHATCEGSGHTKVPRGFPIKTQLLDLRGNHFHFLRARSFPGTSQVVSLHLEFCKIHEIEGNAFQGMKSLLYLYLSDNYLTSLDPRAFAGVPDLTYLHLEGNQLVQFPGSALSLTPNLFVLHLERNSISKLEPSGLLSSVTPTLRELYLSNNTITVIAKAALSSAFIETLHLDSNQLTEVPTDALPEAPNLEELNLSRNSIGWVGPKAFQSISQSLRRLYMDHMGMEKMSKDVLLDLGPGLKVLTLRGNQLKVLPDLSPLTGLEMVDLQDNPLLCDCALEPLHRWVENVRLEVTATCDLPPELRGQQVRDVPVFTACPKIIAPSNETAAVEPRISKMQKSKPSSLKPRKVKARPGRAKIQKQPKKPSQMAKKTENKKTVNITN